jgi:hypothetical protein
MNFAPIGLELEYGLVNGQLSMYIVVEASIAYNMIVFTRDTVLFLDPVKARITGNVNN